MTDIAKRYGVAVLLVHHLKKAGTDDPMDQISGTLGLNGAADAMLVLKRERGQADAVLHIHGRDIEESGEFNLQWDPQLGLWRLAGAADQPHRDPTRQSIINTLGERGPMTATQLAEVLGRKTETIRAICRRMAKGGELGGEGKRGQKVVYDVAPNIYPSPFIPFVPPTPLDGATGASGTPTPKHPWRDRLIDPSTSATAFLDAETPTDAMSELERQFGKGRVMAVEPLNNTPNG